MNDGPRILDRVHRSGAWWATIAWVFSMCMPAMAHAQDAAPGAFVPPKPINLVKPTYPQDALDQDIEDSVGLVLYIDDKGIVVKVDVETPAKNERFGFDEAARAALLASTFEPARQGGQAVAVKIRYTQPFAIERRDPVLKDLVQADYPPLALREGVVDAVVGKLDLDASGKVVNAEIYEAAQSRDY